MPLNRFITFIKPYLNLVAGAIAAWLVAKANVLGMPGLDQANATTWIAGALAWLATQGATQLGDLKWLKGHHIALAGDTQVQAAAIAAPTPAPPSAAGVDPDHEALIALDEQLPDDEEELADTIIDDAMPDDVDVARPVMPSEVALEGEPDEDDEDVPPS